MPGIANNKKNETVFFSKKTSLPNSLSEQYHIINVPAGGSCLFWAIALAYLFECKEDIQSFDSESCQLKLKGACRNLFGEMDEKESKKLVETIIKLIGRYHSKIDRHDRNLEINSFDLGPKPERVTTLFRKRVVDYMREHEAEFKEIIRSSGNTDFVAYLDNMLFPIRFGGEPEIRAIVKLFNCNIQVFDVQRQATRFYAADSQEAFDAIQTEESSFIIKRHTLNLFYEADKKHYYFGVENPTFLQERIRNFAELPCIESWVDSGPPNQKYVLDSSLEESEIIRRPIKSRISKKTVQRVEDSNFSLIENSYVSTIVEGISIGIFLEMLLYLLPASPLAKVIFDNETIQKLTFSKFIESPYRYYEDCQSLLLRSTQFDALLANFLNIKKPFTTGILYGAMGGLIKTVLDRQESEAVLLMTAMFTVLPIESEPIGRMQIFLLSLLMPWLLRRGLMSLVNFSLSCLSKTTEIVQSLTNKMSTRIASFSFFAAKETEATVQNSLMDSGVCPQLDIGAFHR